jgi:hypothetical protein
MQKNVRVRFSACDLRAAEDVAGKDML